MLSPKNLTGSWKEKLKDEFSKDYFIKLNKFLDTCQQKGEVIFPVKKNIFNAFNSCSFEQTKVVIIGQDPYHGENQAHGLSFSVQKDVKLPPSLKNIFKELDTDMGIQTDSKGELSPWAKQGVLLLNNVLTVQKGLAASHQKKGWEVFTDRVISLLNTEKENLVFILWGAPAQKKGKDIDTTKHLVLKAPHPSPLSSYRGFFGSRPFSKTNNYLLEKGVGKIDWRIEPS